MAMNKQFKIVNGRKVNSKIEWTDYTWNPIGGCLHGCQWAMPDGATAVCYAKTVAERVAQQAYPDGFEHHYWRPDRLVEPLNMPKPARIFVDSMSDLMGHWVPDEQIEAVLDVCRRADHHTFQLLTKNPPRLTKFKFPPNVWVGISAPPSQLMGKPLSLYQQQRWLIKGLSALSHVDVPVRWMSIEPLSWNISMDLHDFGWVGSKPILQWAVIGAATNGKTVYQPEPHWVDETVGELDAMHAPVFFKGNLAGNEGADPWREDFPQVEAAQS